MQQLNPNQNEEGQSAIYASNVATMEAFFEDCEMITNTINIMKSAAEKYLLSLEKQEQDFKTLLKPKKFITSYPAILKEVNRRVAFNHFSQKRLIPYLEEVNAMIAKEKQERSTFLKTYGDVIPQDFIPQLKVVPSPIPISFFNPDQECQLPLVDDWIELSSINCPGDYYSQIQSLSAEDLDRIPSRQPLQEMTLPAKDQENILNEGPRVKVGAADLLEEMKELKRNYNKCHELNKRLHDHLQELTLSYESEISAKISEIQALKSFVSDEQMQNSPTLKVVKNKEEDRVAKVYKLLSNICQTNYQYMQQNVTNYSTSSKDKPLLSMSISGYNARIKDLEGEVEALKSQLSEAQGKPQGLSKSDHIKYVNQLHEVYRAEIEKVQKEKNELIANYQVCAQRLDDLKGSLGSLEETIHNERAGKVQALNELTYKKIEMERLQEDFVSKTRELKRAYEEKIFNLQTEIIEKDSKVEEFNLKIGEYQSKIREIQKEFDQQTVSFSKKVGEKKEECERQKALADKANAKLAENQKELQKLTSDLEKLESHNDELIQKTAKYQSSVETLNCQLVNMKIINENLTKLIEQKSIEVREANDRFREKQYACEKAQDANEQLKQKIVSLSKRVEGMEQHSLDRLDKQSQQHRLQIATLEEQIAECNLKIQQQNSIIDVLNEAKEALEGHIENIQDKLNTYQILTKNDAEVQTKPMIQESYLDSDKEIKILEQKESYEVQKQALIDTTLNFNDALQRGTLVLFVPVLPGLYVCLNLSGSALNNLDSLSALSSHNSIVSTFNNTQAIAQNLTFAGGNVKAAVRHQYKTINKEILQASVILDVETLDAYIFNAKTQAILNKFDMLVIGRCEGDELTGEVYLDKREIVLGEQIFVITCLMMKMTCKGKPHIFPQGTFQFDDPSPLKTQQFTVNACRVKVCKLVALNPLEFNIYHFNY